jgi:excisionase family DNA binding protein
MQEQVISAATLPTKTARAQLAQDAVTQAVEELVQQLTAATAPQPSPEGQRPRRPYTVKQVAAALGVSGSTVYRDIEAGRLEAYRIGVGKGTLRIPHDALQRYMARITAEAVTKPASVVA